MPDRPFRRASRLASWLLVLAAGCGREAPWFAPDAAPGGLAVLSTPAGAEILLDGLPTGLTTPDTLLDLAPGAHTVRLRSWGWAVAPESLQVEVTPSVLAEAAFALAPLATGPPRTVLLEAFSNVSCAGCPEMAQTVRALMDSPGYGPERVLLVKYSTDFPLSQDPLYLGSSEANDLRWDRYVPGGAAAIPLLLLNGGVLGEPGAPPNLPALTAAADLALAQDSGLSLIVTAEPDQAQIPVRVTVAATRHLDLSGCALHVALVEDPVLFARPPGNQGETEFHCVMRAFATVAVGLASPGPEAPLVFDVQLSRNPAWLPDALEVVAFVQGDDGRVLQAGSTAAPPPGRRASRRTGRPGSIVKAIEGDTP